MKNTNKDLEKKFSEAEKLRADGNFSEAIIRFKNILKDYPKLQPALNNIANCYVQINDFELAENYYLECLKINSNIILTLNNLALLYLKNKNFKKALNVLQASLKKNLNQEHIAEKIAYCLTELDLPKDVDQFCEKFIKIYPQNKIILSYYRRNLFKIGKYEAGLKAYQKETGVIELDDDKVNIA